MSGKMNHNAGEIVGGPFASVPLFRDKGTDTKGTSPVIFPRYIHSCRM